jgi:hypothetical protein
MNDLLKAPQRSWPSEITVEPSRLAMGIWGESEGDISAAYCADTFPKIKTFVHDGQLFANLGGLAEESIGGYPLVPEQDYSGPEPRQYTYEGRTAIFKGVQYKLGPKVIFAVRERTIEEWTDLHRRMYADGGYFAAGKTYRQVLLDFREKARVSETKLAAIDAELALANLPSTQQEMLARLHVLSTSPITQLEGSQMELVL